MGEARATIAAVLVADPDDIALTHSTTDGINLALVVADVAGRGPRVTTTTTSTRASSARCRRSTIGSASRSSCSTSATAGTTTLTIEAFRRALERPAQAVVFSHVLWTTGAILPVGRIGTLARDAGAVAIIDGAQAAGAIPLVLEDLDVDAYALPGQKWLLGPEGMGALWARRSWADSVVPARRATSATRSSPRRP